MSPLALLLIAVGVSADAFAVAAARGVTIRRGTVAPALAIAATFGAFQALMPLLGWLVGSRVADGIDRVDHWIAFGLLAAVGVRMIREAFTEDDDGPARLGLREDRCRRNGGRGCSSTAQWSSGFGTSSPDVGPHAGRTGGRGSRPGCRPTSSQRP